MLRFTPITLTDAERERLFLALGGPGNYSIISEQAFLDQTECPPAELESWLESEWIQHDIAAVLTGAEKVGLEPVLLVRDAHQGAMRLFCPTEELIAGNIREEGRMHLRRVIAARSWPESAEEIISQVEAVSAACSNRGLSTIEIRMLWLALWPAIQILLELRDRPFTKHVKRLHAAMVTLRDACQKRGSDHSPQARYGEAQVCSRRALSENHDPALDGLPELVDICREACSEELTTYMAEEVLLPYDQFLEMLQMVAHNRADASTVENPPGRIRTALARAGRRKAFLDRQRSQQLTLEQSDGLTDLRDVESEVIADVDLERAKRDVALPPDQTRAVEARLNGVDLQAADANDYLGWDAARLKAVRRSLASDRRWGQRLRKRLSAYRRRRNSPKQP